MPVYIYRCSACDIIYETSHKFREKPQGCPECKETKYLEKQLTTPISVVKRIKQGNNKKETGQIVKEAIIDNREQLKQQKEEMKKKRNK